MATRYVVSAVLVVLGSGIPVLAPTLTGQEGVAYGEWPTYGGEASNTKFAPLSGIGRANVTDVEVVWEWRSPDDAIASAAGFNPGTFKATPIMTDGVLYVRTSLSLVAAIDAATGEQLWVFDPKSHEAGRPTNLGFNTRGVARWAGPDGSRIFVATGDAYLWAVDAATGTPVDGFGEGGRIDLTQGLRRPVPRDEYTVMSPPLVVGDVVIVGSSISDVPRSMTAPPGDVRAFDVRTGEQRWIFHTVPQPGEMGNETWEDESWAYTGNANVWTIMSADEELGLVYLPVGTPTNDWYGGHRPGDNLFAESLVALDAETGRRVWHYQMVHHGVWDYDPPAAPILLDVTVDGRPIRAVAQLTKQGFVFVFDRMTGEPVWPIVERPVPPSTVPGERLSPTQPFPTRPAPFERQGISEDGLIDFTPELRQEALELVRRFDHGDLFHPPSERGTINVPGWFGGANWWGASADPTTGMLYVPSRTSAMVVQLVAGDPERTDFRYVRGGAQTIAGPRGFPLFKPPYVRVTAIDLNTGDHVWQVPLGDGPRRRLVEMGVPDPGPLGGGAFTGPLLTESFLFVGHSGSRNGGTSAGGALLALDTETGQTVHGIALPGAPTGTPMTYVAAERQFIVVAVTRDGWTGLVGLAVP